jgi:ribonuclease HII
MSIIYTIGIDEVGRGALAGPLGVGYCMAKCDFPFHTFFSLVRDSKKLSLKKRNEWAEKIKKEKCLISGVVYKTAKEIDEKGLSFLLKESVKDILKNEKVDPEKTRILLDGGLFAPKEYLFQETLIRGDEKEVLISAASIIAKVARDKKMTLLEKKYPEYAFSLHKGYGTSFHREMIQKYGYTPYHRKSFCLKKSASDFFTSC